MTVLFFCHSVQETSGHRAFEVRRQLVADVTANDTGGTAKTLEWAAKQPEAAAVPAYAVKFWFQLLSSVIWGFLFV